MMLETDFVPRIFFKPDSPLGAIDARVGVPVLAPVPTEMNQGVLLWDVDLDLIDDQMLAAIASVEAARVGRSTAYFVDHIRQVGQLGIPHRYVAGLVGDVTTPDELEGLGRTCRIRLLLEEFGSFALVMSITDAICLFCESTYGLNAFEEASFTRLAIAAWLPHIIEMIEPLSVVTAKFLKRELFGDEKLGIADHLDSIADLKVELRIPAFTAYLLVGVLCMRLRSDSGCTIKQDVHRHATILQTGVMTACPEAAFLLERAWHPEFDVDSQV
jgi:hypothetical protein